MHSTFKCAGPAPSHRQFAGQSQCTALSKPIVGPGCAMHLACCHPLKSCTQDNSWPCVCQRAINSSRMQTHHCPDASGDGHAQHSPRHHGKPAIRHLYNSHTPQFGKLDGWEVQACRARQACYCAGRRAHIFSPHTWLKSTDRASMTTATSLCLMPIHSQCHRTSTPGHCCCTHSSTICTLSWRGATYSPLRRSRAATNLQSK